MKYRIVMTETAYESEHEVIIYAVIDSRREYERLLR